MRCQRDSDSDQCAKLHGGLNSDLKVSKKVVKIDVEGKILKPRAAGEHLFV